jgi:hypothetical protein
MKDSAPTLGLHRVSKQYETNTISVVSVAEGIGEGLEELKKSAESFLRLLQSVNKAKGLRDDQNSTLGGILNCKKYRIYCITFSESRSGKSS